MTPPLSLHVPVPPHRRGGAASFGDLDLPAAGEVRWVEPSTAEAEIRDLPYTLIRVLDQAGRAVGPWDPKLGPEPLKAGLRAMLLTRLFDERMFRAHRQGKTSFFITSTGEEALGAAPSLLLGPGDMSFPTYRLVSWLMARGYPLVDLFNQIFSNAEDPLGGRQLPILYSAREYGFYSLSGNVGSRLGHAVGWAMASAYSHDDKVAIGYIGEGSTAEGDFHEALTFASVYRAPAILCVTNNQWAISTFSGVATGQAPTFAAKALAYGLPGLRVDGNDFLAVWAATAWAAERARSGNGATLIEFFTYRAAGHSTSDDPTRYRPAEESGRWPLGDPIERLKAHLITSGCWSEAEHKALADELIALVRQSLAQAEAVGAFGRSKPSLHEMFEGVFKTPDWRVLEQRRELGL